MVDDPELLELVEMEVRDLLCKIILSNVLNNISSIALYKYDGANATVIRGSALCALTGDKPELGKVRRVPLLL